VSGLSESLHQILAVEGAAAAAVVDAATGMIVSSASAGAAEFRVAAAASAAEETRWVKAALGPSRPGGDLEEMLMATASRFHLVKVLNRWPDEGLLLFVDLDRSRTNIALAVQQVGRAAAGLLA
jgi:peptide subunit release factor 1 (eRF1)